MRYPEEVKEYMRQIIPGRTCKEVVDLVNEKYDVGITESKVRSFKGNYKIKSGTPKGLPKGHATKVFPSEVKAYINQNYKGVSHAEMARRLNEIYGTQYTRRQIRAYYGNYGLNSGLDGKFPKGHVPPNKGKKGYCSPGSEKGWFKNGERPTNFKEIGSERIDRQGYTLVKIKNPSTWRFKHRLLWEKERGKIPDGMKLVFKDGDKSNITLENLELVSKYEALILNRKNLIHENPEISEVGINIAKVYGALNDRKNSLKKSKEDHHE